MPRTISLLKQDGSVRAEVLIDSADFEWVSAWRWTYQSPGYAVRMGHADGPDGVRLRKIYMHRLILGLQAGDPREADHINGDRLDNRHCNLRIVVRKEQMQNQIRKPRTSRYRGVHWSTTKRVWVAQAHVNGRKTFLGHYHDERLAAEAAARCRAEHMPFAVESRNPL